MEIITGEKFISDNELKFEFDFLNDSDIDGQSINQYGEVKKFYKKNSKNVYMMTTAYVDLFFKNPPKEKFILITHNSDGSIIDSNGKRGCENCGQEYCANIENIPENLVKWFGINITTNHEKLQSLPIGIENNRSDFPINREEILKKVQMKKKKNKNLLYLNFFFRHNPSERLEPFELFSDKSWVTSVNVHNSLNGLNYESFLDEINSHKFILCPEGVGPDTYRVWESLYLRSIPIIKKKIFSQYYHDLPVCYVNEWSDITEEFLLNEYKRIQNTQFNLQKMDYNYWKNIILNSIEEISL